jgi:hypothetical protein
MGMAECSLERSLMDEWKKIQLMFEAINEALEPDLPKYIVLVNLDIECYEDHSKGYRQVTPIYLN